MVIIVKQLAASAAVLCIVTGAAGDAQASNDPYGDRLWGIDKIGAPQAWSAGRGAGVVIAIVDTGVDAAHEDLKANMVAGYDFVGSDDDPRDEHGHGTHVAGTAAAVADNGLGVAGVAPKARIMPVRVLGADGKGTSRDVDAGVRWAVDHGAKVVNLSLGDDATIELDGGSLSGSVNYAWSRGAIAVVAVDDEPLIRAELTAMKAFIVTATTREDEQAPYASDVGFAQWGIAAPGGTSKGGAENAILSTYWSKTGSSYAYAEGTSMAAPHVSGAAAVLLGLGLSPQAVVDRLLETARDIGAEGDDSRFGHGRVDLAAAVAGPGRSTRQEGGSLPASADASEPEQPQSPADARRRSVSAELIASPSPTSGAQAAPARKPDRTEDRDGMLAVVVSAIAILVASAAAWASTRLRRRRTRV